MPALELTPHAVAAGGDGLARDAEGRVVLVGGALPGERVRVEVLRDRRDVRLAHVTAILEPSVDRVVPPCPIAGRCGGCGWQHVDPAAQRRHKVDIVADALRRTGGLPAAEVHAGPTLEVGGHRTTVRAAVVGDRAGFRRARSHDVILLEQCLVSHPAVEEVLVGGRFPGATEVVVRVGARTGERLVVVDPAADDADVPGEARVIGVDELDAGRRAWIHEEIEGTRFRVSARSFLQSRPDGAEALVAEVRAAAAAPGGPPPGSHLVDLYAGIGLFGRLLGGDRPVTAVEWNPSALADARVNLAPVGARVVRADVGRWRPRRAGLVVADPPRAGLGRSGVAAVSGTGAGRLVLVSCDAASLARDAALLAERGFVHRGSTLVDLFPHTPHVEVVTRFDR